MILTTLRKLRMHRQPPTTSYRRFESLLEAIISVSLALASYLLWGRSYYQSSYVYMLVPTSSIIDVEATAVDATVVRRPLAAAA